MYMYIIVYIYMYLLYGLAYQAPEKLARNLAKMERTYRYMLGYLPGCLLYMYMCI